MLFPERSKCLGCRQRANGGGALEISSMMFGSGGITAVHSDNAVMWSRSGVVHDKVKAKLGVSKSRGGPRPDALNTNNVQTAFHATHPHMVGFGFDPTFAKPP
ncbi:hypothetical protein HanPI659440_Chr15g0579861 [Helianthus annuus]|nr:hypothetical protein HanPI659440_Chr15g0579861 [Helianthus annuus]